MSEPKLIGELIAESSIGQALRWSAFGRELRETRERFGVSAEDAAKWSGIDRNRLLEIEAAAPPEATEAEVGLLETALCVEPGSLWAKRPR